MRRCSLVVSVAFAAFPLIGFVASATPEDLAQAEAKTELGLVPLAGGNTDFGVAMGVMGQVARVAPDRDPYVWRTEFAAITSFKSQDDRLTLPYQDYYVLATVPELASGLRGALRISFTRSQMTGYYGLGNASPDMTRVPSMSAKFDQYDRIYPSIRLDLRLALQDRLYLRFMPTFTQNWVNIYGGSKLEEDRATVRAPHSLGVPMIHTGLVWDSRDDEINTTGGAFHELSIRAAPLTIGDGADGYGGANLTARWFLPILRPYLVLATRFIADELFGSPPVYELSQVEETSSLGGEFGVRGVPAQRFSGRTKLYGNVEIRAQLLPFRAFDQSFILGTVAFFDAGRVFASLTPDPALDGGGIGIHYGAGGGIRLGWGETFVVRADMAWSPDANPIGLYVNAGQTF